MKDKRLPRGSVYATFSPSPVSVHTLTSIYKYIVSKGNLEHIVLGKHTIHTFIHLSRRTIVIVQLTFLWANSTFCFSSFPTPVSLFIYTYSPHQWSMAQYPTLSISWLDDSFLWEFQAGQLVTHSPPTFVDSKLAKMLQCPDDHFLQPTLHPQAW